MRFLAKRKSTSPEISQKLGIKINLVQVYLNELLDQNKVERLNDKKPYDYRSKIPLRYLIDLHKIMNNYMDFKEKPDENAIDTIKIIEEMIKV